MHDAVLVERSPAHTAGTVERSSAVSAKAPSKSETNWEAKQSNYKPRFVNNGGSHPSAAQFQSHKVCDWCRSRAGTPKTLFARTANLRRGQRRGDEKLARHLFKRRGEFGGMSRQSPERELMDRRKRRDVQNRSSALTVWRRDLRSLGTLRQETLQLGRSSNGTLEALAALSMSCRIRLMRRCRRRPQDIKHASCPAIPRPRVPLLAAFSSSHPLSGDQTMCRVKRRELRVHYKVTAESRRSRRNVMILPKYASCPAV
jgi:hypothetical protein